MSSSTHIKILVVDDDWISLSIVSSLLRKMSFEVVTVKSPVDAIATLRMQRDYFDLVVTDLHMPLMNGSQLAKQVNLEFKNIPVILMSADDKESVMMECLESGAVYYIIKPINPDDLKNVWQFASAAKKGKSRALQEIMENVTLQDLENINLDDEEEDTLVDHSLKNEHTSKTDSGGIKKRKASRSPENEGTGSYGVKLKKRKVVWTTVLHNLFLQAVRHIGLDKAVPKKILGFMSVPGLTRENVASHLQKYRLFLKKLAMKNACPTRNVLSDRSLRSSFVDPSMSLMLMQQLYPNQMVMRSRGGYSYAAGGAAGHGFNSYGQNKARLSSLGPALFPSSRPVVRPQNRYNNGQYQYPPASNFQQPMLFGTTNTPNPFQANHNSYYGAGSSLSNNISFNSGTNNSLRLYQAQRNYGGSSNNNNFNPMRSNCSSNQYYNPNQVTPPRNYNAGNEMAMSANASNNMNEPNSSSSAGLIGNPTATMTVATGFGNTNQLINNPTLAMPEGNNTNCSNATTLRGNLGHGNLHELSYSFSSAAQIANANRCNPVSPMLGDNMGQMGAQLAFAGGNHNGNQLNATTIVEMSGNSCSLDDLLASTTITTNSTLNNNNNSSSSNNNSVHSDIFGHAIDLDAIFNNPLQHQDKSKEVMSSNGSANPSMNGEVNFDDLSDLFPMELENASWNGQSLVQNQASQEVENTNFGSASTPLFQFGDNVVASFGQNPSQNQVAGHDAISNFNMINNSTVQLNNGYQLSFQHNINQNEVSEGVVGGGSMHQTNDYNSSFMIQNPSQQQDTIGGGSMIQNVNDQDHWSDNGLMQFFYSPN